MRNLRQDLDRELARILLSDPALLRPGCPPAELIARIEHGSLLDADHGLSKSYLVTPGGRGLSAQYKRLPDGRVVTAHICLGTQALAETIDRLGSGTMPIIAIELVNMAFQLRHWLERIPPRRRGRPTAR
jgi:hypothetical protein